MLRVTILIHLKLRRQMIDITISDKDIDDLVSSHNERITDTSKHWHFDDERRHVLKTWDDVQACPGSGKTTLVAAKLLLLAKKWREQHKGICVLTHTNVARDEIISKLLEDPSGFRITSYPHFIGTIQEFINRFLAFPYYRTKEWNVTQISNDDFARYFSRVRWKKVRDKISGKNYWFNYYENSNRIRAEELFFIYSNGRLSINPKFIEAVDRHIDRNKCDFTDKYIETKKTEYLRLGVSQYRDAYAFAELLAHENADIIRTIRRRFPIVLIDEMQDTQKFQDVLINKIFQAENIRYQRLGDPDQALFDGMGGEEPNQTYNTDSDLFEIHTTHRFGLDISEKLIGLSYNQLDQLTTNRQPNRGNCAHTIFIYNDSTQACVLDKYGELLDGEDPQKQWQAVKAVGGVDGPNGYIKNYFPKFDKNRSKASPKPEKLIHIVDRCHNQIHGHVSENYDLLLQGIIDLLRKEGKKSTKNNGSQVYYSQQSFIQNLKHSDRYTRFRKLLTSWIMGCELNPTNWATQCQELKGILDISELSAEGKDYLAHDNEHYEQDEQHGGVSNVYKCSNGREVEVGTIHSVKGETHDATLIMETKFRKYFDIREMLPFMLDYTKNRPSFVPTSPKSKDTILATYIRRLYVATSRPRYLLCLAIHEDNINDNQICKLKKQGWTESICV